MRKIPLTNGMNAIVSDRDYGRVSKFKWFARRHGNTFYAARSLYKPDTQSSDSILMHRFILNAKRNVEVDHKDRNGLHNFRRNLRLCTRAQNSRNRAQFPHSSIYKGVSFCKWTGRWESKIQFDGKQKRLGRFDSEAQAALAYNRSAKKLFRKFARLNEI